GGLGNFSFTTGLTANVTGPQVIGVSPPDQLTGVPRNTQIIIDFDRTIDTLTVNQITLTAGATPVQTLIAFSNNDTRVTLTPVVLLPAGTLHTLTIGAVTDLSGLPLNPTVVRHFTTSTGADLIAPQVTLTSPVNGAVNVPTNVQIRLAVNERLD